MGNGLNERLFFGYAYIFEKENEAPKFVRQEFDENEEVKLSLVESISEATMFNSPAIANEVGKYISGFGHRGFVGQCLPTENGYATVFEVSGYDDTSCKYVISGARKDTKKKVYISYEDKLVDRLTDARTFDKLEDALDKLKLAPVSDFWIDVINLHVENACVSMVSVDLSRPPKKYPVSAED